MRGGDAGLAESLRSVTATNTVDVSASPSGMLRALRDGSRAIMLDRCEAIHLVDARLAPAALMLRARFGVPVTATISPHDVSSSRVRAAVSPLPRLDYAFTHDEGTFERLASVAPRLPVTLTPPAVSPLGEPSKRRLDAIACLLSDITPGRLIVAMPWPEDTEQVRWFRDSVMPLLHGNPVLLLLGAPGRRQVRLLAGAVGQRAKLRAHIGRLDLETLAAGARCADVLVMCAQPRRAPLDDLLLAMMASRAPVVVGGGVRSIVAEHERNAFVVDPSDAMGATSTLNQLLALPAVQRHHLGEDFAKHTLERWSWEAVADVYAARFSTLVGRPRIPAQLRAA